MENAALMKLSHTMTKSQKIDQSVMMIDDGSQLYNSPGKTNRDNKTINASKLATSSYIPAPAPNQIVLHKELFQQPNSEKKLLHLSVNIYYYYITCIIICNNTIKIYIGRIFRLQLLRLQLRNCNKRTSSNQQNGL